MTPAQRERLMELLQRLRLFKSRERLEALLQDASSRELSYADFLDAILGEEVASKREKNVAMRTNLARFPFVKRLDAFDFSYQPSLDKKRSRRSRPATSSSTARTSWSSGRPASERHISPSGSA